MAAGALDPSDRVMEGCVLSNLFHKLTVPEFVFKVYTTSQILSVASDFRGFGFRGSRIVRTFQSQ